MFIKVLKTKDQTSAFLDNVTPTNVLLRILNMTMYCCVSRLSIMMEAMFTTLMPASNLDV